MNSISMARGSSYPISLFSCKEDDIETFAKTLASSFLEYRSLELQETLEISSPAPLPTLKNTETHSLKAQLEPSFPVLTTMLSFKPLCTHMIISS